MMRRKRNLLAAMVASALVSGGAFAQALESPHSVQTPASVNEAAPAVPELRIPAGEPALPAMMGDGVPGYPANPHVATIEPQIDPRPSDVARLHAPYGYTRASGATYEVYAETPSVTVVPPAPVAQPGAGQPAIPPLDRPASVSESAPERTGEQTAAPFAGDSHLLPSPATPHGVPEAGPGLVGGDPATPTQPHEMGVGGTR
jgi:hypothetical protein